MSAFIQIKLIYRLVFYFPVKIWKLDTYKSNRTIFIEVILIFMLTFSCLKIIISSSTVERKWL